MDKINLSMKRIRVLHILNSGIYSGAEKVAIFIIKATKDQCDSVYLSPDGYINTVLEKESIRHYSVRKVTPGALRKAIHELTPDLLHAHDFKDSIAVAMCGMRVPVISHLHQNPPWIKKVNAKSVAFFLCRNRMDRILTVSEAVMREYVFRKQIEKKTYVVGNPVNIQDIRKRSKEYAFDEDMDLIMIGRLAQPKNPFRFIRIIKQIKDQYPLIKCGIIGEGELRQTVESEITKEELEENVRLFGFIDNPLPILKRSKILCVTSDWEGFGLVAVEALALNVPVVCMKVGGLPDIVDETCGRVCDREETFVSEVFDLLSDSTGYEALRKGAEKKADKLNNIEQYINTIQNVYVQLCG